MIDNPPFLLTSVWRKVPKDCHLGVKRRLGSFMHGVFCAHRCNFSCHVITFPPMYDCPGIRPNLKCLRSMCLGPHVRKRRESLLRSFIHYHRLTVVSLVAKACRRDFEKVLLNTILLLLLTGTLSKGNDAWN
ncbi:hypothetical protein MXB_4301 [Myxobolus squamalis]|nr:hypothetical protein MXB_4301 [Myxobolus squamalis]